jgi:zinc/manganese transport system substrate-binding protein
MSSFLKRMICLTAAAALMGGAAGQEAEKKKVACTIPALRAIAAELAGDGFEVFALSRPDQDVHFVSPTPPLWNKVRTARLFIEIGLQLEIWAPDVTNNSGNSKIQPGREGHIVASEGISREEMPKVVSRSEGDVHPEGNPHIWLDPLRAKQIAENISAALKKVAPERGGEIDRRLETFKSRIDEAVFGADLVKLVGSKKLNRLALDGELWSYLDATEADGAKLATRIGGWLKKGERLRGTSVIEFHRSWIYLAKLLGFQIVGAIEAKPGIEPGPKHIADLIETVKTKKARLILVDNFYDLSKPRYVEAQAGAKVVVLPGQPGGEPGTDDYFSFIDRIVTDLVKGLGAGRK